MTRTKLEQVFIAFARFQHDPKKKALATSWEAGAETNLRLNDSNALSSRQSAGVFVQEQARSTLLTGSIEP